MEVELTEYETQQILEFSVCADSNLSNEKINKIWERFRKEKEELINKKYSEEQITQYLLSHNILNNLTWEIATEIYKNKLNKNKSSL